MKGYKNVKDCPKNNPEAQDGHQEDWTACFQKNNQWLLIKRVTNFINEHNDILVNIYVLCDECVQKLLQHRAG